MGISEQVIGQFSGLTWQGLLTESRTLLFFAAGITLYALFIFRYWHFLARRDIFQLKDDEYYNTFAGNKQRLLRLAFYILENLVLTPIIVLFWFMVLAGFLAVLSNQAGLGIVLLVSAAFVASVRIVSYFSEEDAQDLAKLIPLTLLAVFIADLSLVSNKWVMFNDMYLMVQTSVYYVITVTAIEYAMRITHGVTTFFTKREPTDDQPT
jgi:hypothetical protein